MGNKKKKMLDAKDNQFRKAVLIKKGFAPRQQWRTLNGVIVKTVQMLHFFQHIVRIKGAGLNEAMIACTRSSCTETISLKTVYKNQSTLCLACRGIGQYLVSGRFTKSKNIFSQRDLIVGWRDRGDESAGRHDYRPLIMCSYHGCATQIQWDGKCTMNQQAKRRCKKHDGERQRTPVFSGKFNELKQDSLKRGIEFSLTYKQILKIMMTRVCYYCGDEVVVADKVWGRKKASSAPLQLDRKNNDKGYTVRNLVRCCSVCNFSKSRYLHSDEMRVVALVRVGQINQAINFATKNIAVFSRHNASLREQKKLSSRRNGKR